MHGEHWFVRAAYSLRLSPPNTQTQRMLIKVQFLCSSEKKMLLYDNSNLSYSPFVWFDLSLIQ